MRLRHLLLVGLLFVVGVALGPISAGVTASSVTTVLRLDGIGPLRLGMSRSDAVATGWLARPRTGCPLGGTPLPIVYRIAGPTAPPGLRGDAEFAAGRLRSLAFTAGVRTAVGVTVAKSTIAETVAAYRRAGLRASARYDPTFVGTFVSVGKGSEVVLGAFAERRTIATIGIPFVPVCE